MWNICTVFFSKETSVFPGKYLQFINFSDTHFFYYRLFLLLVWGIPVACKKLNTKNMNVLGSKELHRKIGHVMEQIFENVLWGYKVLESCHLGRYLSLGMTNGFQWVATHINWWWFPGLLCWEGFRGLLNSVGKKSASYVCPGHEFCHLF